MLLCRPPNGGPGGWLLIPLADVEEVHAIAGGGFASDGFDHNVLADADVGGVAAAEHHGVVGGAVSEEDPRAQVEVGAPALSSTA